MLSAPPYPSVFAVVRLSRTASTRPRAKRNSRASRGWAAAKASNCSGVSVTRSQAAETHAVAGICHHLEASGEDEIERPLGLAASGAAMPPMIGASIVAMDHELDPPLVTLMVGIGIRLAFLTLPVRYHLLGTF